MGFLWASVAVLGRAQVDCGLHDHFATTVAHLLPKCALSVGEILVDGTPRNHFVTTAMSIGGSWAKFQFTIFTFYLNIMRKSLYGRGRRITDVPKEIVN